MQITDAKNFRNILSGMGRLFSNELDGLVLDAYWLALSDWSFDDFQVAAARLMKTSKFMPRPADFEELRKAAQETGGEAFGRRREFLVWGLHGYSIRPGTARRIAASIAAAGGADAIAMASPQQLTFLEKRFCEHYAEIGEVQEIREALPQLGASDRLKQLGNVVKLIGAK